jgi:hypothetical protein
MSPEGRHRLAVWTLGVSIVGGLLSIAGWLLGFLDDRALIGQTLVLSWVTQATTAWDVASTTDVRVQQEEQ